MDYNQYGAAAYQYQYPYTSAYPSQPSHFNLKVGRSAHSKYAIVDKNIDVFFVCNIIYNLGHFYITYPWLFKYMVLISYAYILFHSVLIYHGACNTYLIILFLRKPGSVIMHENPEKVYIYD